MVDWISNSRLGRYFNRVQTSEAASSDSEEEEEIGKSDSVFTNPFKPSYRQVSTQDKANSRLRCDRQCCYIFW